MSLLDRQSEFDVLISRVVKSSVRSQENFDLFQWIVFYWSMYQRLEIFVASTLSAETNPCKEMDDAFLERKHTAEIRLLRCMNGLQSLTRLVFRACQFGTGVKGLSEKLHQIKRLKEISSPPCETGNTAPRPPRRGFPWLISLPTVAASLAVSAGSAIVSLSLSTYIAQLMRPLQSSESLESIEVDSLHPILTKTFILEAIRFLSGPTNADRTRHGTTQLSQLVELVERVTESCFLLHDLLLALRPSALHRPQVEDFCCLCSKELKGERVHPSSCSPNHQFHLCCFKSSKAKVCPLCNVRVEDLVVVGTSPSSKKVEGKPHFFRPPSDQESDFSASSLFHLLLESKDQSVCMPKRLGHSGWSGACRKKEGEGKDNKVPATAELGGDFDPAIVVRDLDLAESNVEHYDDSEWDMR